MFGFEMEGETSGKQEGWGRSVPEVDVTGTDMVKSIGKEEGKSFSIHGALSKPRCDKNSSKITDQVQQEYSSPELIKHWEHGIL